MDSIRNCKSCKGTGKRMPPTAYACGPVLTAEKPDEELAELCDESDFCDECGIEHGANGCEEIRELVGDEG